MARKRTGVSGPYQHGRRWRVVCQAAGQRTVESFETRAEADAFIAEWRASVEGETVMAEIDRWLAMVAKRGRRAITLRTLRAAVQRLAVHLPDKLHDVTPGAAVRAYAALVKSGAAVDTHRNSLNVARSMWTQLFGKDAKNPWGAVEGVGARVKGKPQLTIDESRRFLTAALERGTPGGLAAALCLTLALRAGEVVALEARDVDDGGRILWVQRGKTAAARRMLEVPGAIRPSLLRLAAERPGRLFPVSRGMVGHWVAEICAAARVPKVPPHGLRGTHATIAAAAGATGHLVAAALGHADATVTREHYIAHGAEDAATAKRLDMIMVTTGISTPNDDVTTRN